MPLSIHFGGKLFNDDWHSWVSNSILFLVNRKFHKMSIPKSKPFTVFVEGNIGSGKTTFLEHFRQFEDITLLTEPVEAWRNLQGWNLLVRFTMNFKLSLKYCYILYKVHVHVFYRILCTKIRRNGRWPFRHMFLSLCLRCIPDRQPRQLN